MDVVTKGIGVNQMNTSRVGEWSFLVFVIIAILAGVVFQTSKNSAGRMSEMEEQLSLLVSVTQKNLVDIGAVKAKMSEMEEQLSLFEHMVWVSPTIHIPASSTTRITVPVSLC